MLDFALTVKGPAALLRPLTRRAFTWIAAYVRPPMTWKDGALLVERGDLQPMLDALELDGLAVG